MVKQKNKKIKKNNGRANLILLKKNFFFFISFAVSHGMWDFSSLSRDGNNAPAVEA